MAKRLLMANHWAVWAKQCWTFDDTHHSLTDLVIPPVLLFGGESADDTDCLTVEWDIRYDFKSFLLNNDTKWRLDVDCVNDQCDFRVHATFANEDVPPPLIMPKDWEDIDYLEHAIMEHYPSIIRSISGGSVPQLHHVVPCDRQYSTLLNFVVPLDDVYTFFFEDETIKPPPNSLINNIAPQCCHAGTI
ncbi:uncharacterized protein EDB93DRAFT_1248714 [Suillus bovinus]|uniref:uncharacterized protein n=1 Tax=Suillus bovinus TaxID=48563 RepID=UPI001B8855AD|nr:uncharacterized protein EDB93DRAFT_1248714 [Suillus bovinus]KAG2153442.1 hypothetical protein EDB93DRAFT_1248714 [Suillus bovinus]